MSAAPWLRPGAAALLTLLAVAVPAAAQGTPDQAPPAQGGLVVQQVRSGVIGQPEVKITELDGRTGVLVGGYLGVLTDDTWIVAGGVYTLANPDDDFELTYGGIVVGWQAGGGSAVSVGVKGLIGAGMTTLGLTGAYPWRGMPYDPRRPGTGGATTVRYLVEEGYFIAEPQANIAWRILPWLAIDGGVGYRVTAGAHEFDERLRGVTGTIGVRFGG